MDDEPWNGDDDREVGDDDEEEIEIWFWKEIKVGSHVHNSILKSSIQSTTSNK